MPNDLFSKFAKQGENSGSGKQVAFGYLSRIDPRVQKSPSTLSKTAGFEYSRPPSPGYALDMETPPGHIGSSATTENVAGSLQDSSDYGSEQQNAQHQDTCENN